MIRDVAPNDAAMICEIYNHYIKNSIVTFEEDPVSPEEVQRRIEEVMATHLPWLVLEEEGSVVGYAYASPWSDRSAYRFAAGVTVYLLPSHIGKGLGYKLYLSLFDRLKKQNVHSILGGIALPNPGSIALHEKLGMKKVAHYKEIGFKFGKWIDVAHWQVVI